MVTLYQGDCLEKLKEIPDNSVDCIITSPPYNFDMNYGTYTDNVQWDRYFNWLDTVWKECYRVLVVGGRLVVNIQPRFSDYVPTHHIISNNLRNLGYLWKAEILWEKNNYNCKYTSWGSWKSPSAPYLKYTWEFIEVFVKESYKHEGNSEDIDITADEFIDFVVAKWSFAPETRMQEFEHPAMFPEELPYRCLKLFTYKHDTILDPFMGTGTVGVVCARLDRNFIGIELDSKYFNTAQQRISEALDERDRKFW